jgi:hypothetical protein
MEDLPLINPGDPVASAPINDVIDRVNLLTAGVDTTDIAPQLLNGWTTVGGVALLAYRKLLGGLVIVDGFAGGAPTSGIIFVLPVGYRPRSAIDFPATVNVGGTVSNAGVIRVGNNGNVFFSSSLTGLSNVCVSAVFHASL